MAEETSKDCLQLPAGSVQGVNQNGDQAVIQFATGPDDGPVADGGIVTVNTYGYDTADCEPFCDPDCDPCIVAHVNQVEHVSTADVQALINQSAVQIADSQSACCPRVGINANHPGGTTVIADYNGDNFLNQTFKDYIFGYNSAIETGPNPVLASPPPEFDPTTGESLGIIPRAVYGGPTNKHGEIVCITHIAVNGRWIPLDTGAKRVKCCLYPEGTAPSFPITYTVGEAVWDVCGEEIKLGGLGENTQTFEPSAIRLYPAESGGIPYLGGLATPDQPIYGTGQLQNVINIAGTGVPGSLYTVEFPAWQGNGGTIDPATVTKATVCFDLDGNPANNFGVGIWDAAGDVTSPSIPGTGFFAPVLGVTPPAGGQYTAQPSHVNIFQNPNGGQWSIEYLLPLGALDSNTFEVFFSGVTSETLRNVTLKIDADTGQQVTLNSYEDLAQVLTEADPDGLPWFEECGNVCSYRPKVQAVESCDLKGLGPCG